MEQLSNEEKAKVFAMYLNETTKVETKYSTRQLVGVSIFDQTVDVCEDFDSIEPYYEPIDEVKLILKPLSSITDEDCIEVAKINGVRTNNPGLVGKSIVHWLDKQGENHDVTFEVYQYLISKGYAVPIYPWGKTAIELGIAISLPQ